MVPGTSSGLKRHPLARCALSTRTVLVVVLLVVTVALTGTSLLLVWKRIRQQVRTDLTTDLLRSTRAFGSSETEEFETLQREATLLAELPSLKALLTTDDDRTIRNAAADFWRASGNEMFGLATASGRVRTVYTASQEDEGALAANLAAALIHPEHGYLVSQGHLYRYRTHPVYFGSAPTGTLLGAVVTGYRVNTPAYLARLGAAIDSNVAFFAGDLLLGASLPVITNATFPASKSDYKTLAMEGQVSLNGEAYLSVSSDLGVEAHTPLRVVFYRSLRPAEIEIRDISHQLLLLGALLVLVGSLAMMFVARQLTRPLESLARRVNALEDGTTDLNTPGQLQIAGTQEIRQLAFDFQKMQTRIREANRARLESERLATIGSMATSVSHDLRHHLASIYANAEFLAASDVTEEERGAFFLDIQAAVLGTTEMLESLTIFSRTGQVAQHAPEQVQPLLERAIAQVRIHPAAAKVTVQADSSAANLIILADGRQIERALFNLLLNGCQARRPTDRACNVSVLISCDGTFVSLVVRDNGTGVSAKVKDTLFDPFVSSGKQNGTGLGLTLARRIAEDHGGQVNLVESDWNGTEFALRLPLHSRLQTGPADWPNQRATPTVT